MRYTESKPNSPYLVASIITMQFHCCLTTPYPTKPLNHNLLLTLALALPHPHLHLPL